MYLPVNGLRIAEYSCRTLNIYNKNYYYADNNVFQLVTRAYKYLSCTRKNIILIRSSPNRRQTYMYDLPVTTTSLDALPRSYMYEKLVRAY